MTYVINPLVTINDVDFTSEVLNGLTASAGRTNIDEQPRAGYCTINLIDFDNNVAAVEIDQEIIIKVDDSNGNPTTLWTGFVSDVTKAMNNFGNRGFAVETRITGIGSLAKLNRRRAGATGYAKEFDGDRIFDILLESASERWVDVDVTETWADVNPLQSWATYDILVGEIDRPGDFELTAYNQGAVNGLTLAQNVAANGLGLLYESADGKINYNSFSARLDDVILNGFTDIDLEAIIATNLTSVSRLSDLINNIEVTYKNNQSETGTNTNSIALYGDFQTVISTTLEQQNDAIQRVNYYLDTRAFPHVSLDQITVILSAGVSNELRDTLLGLEISLPIAITGLPANIYESVFNGFVEGYTWTIARNELFLTLNVSDFALSQIQMNWLQVLASETWNTISPALIWENARSVS
jgi:hypothetical protein